MEQKQKKHSDATVMIFQDYSAAVIRKCKSFDEAKKRLKYAGAMYRILYPALLKVSHGGTTAVYSDPGDVDKYLETLN